MAQQFNIGKFRNAVRDLARSKYFAISIPRFSGYLADGVKIPTLLCQATSLPEKGVEVGEIPVQGQAMKVTQSPTIPDWTVTLRLDNDHRIRNLFCAWTQDVHNPQTNQVGRPNDYKADNVIVYPLNSDGTAVNSILFKGIFPIGIGDVEIGQEQDDVQTCQITFAYDYWTMGEQRGNPLFVISIGAGGFASGFEVAAGAEFGKIVASLHI